MDTHKIIAATRHWVETIVIDLNLCPFAKREMVKNSVRFSVSEANTEEQLLFDMHAELDLTAQDDAIETTLLIHPHVLGDFGAYNQFLALTDDLIQQMGLEGAFQVASFHPRYQFTETEPEDPENYTNRSPYPMLHILREASLEVAIAGHPDIGSIPMHNRQLMREMGSDKMKALLKACFITSST